ncbi:leucyl aminopeptidase family protein [Nocardioides cynanchi]|uniref:leucyl aminopeptidase family protein n=1 Tax=Nocardioides cynanchi TaxID=2558918 RepID=UPI001EE24A0D|nr:leucyl aminopeptidase family protein [Nocardioides cynanchi]
MPATLALPAQVSPPAFALSDKTPLELGGVEVMAFSFTAADGVVDLGPEAAETGAALGLDLTEALAAHRATGKAGEIVSVPVAGRGARSALRLVLLVGLGDGTDADFRRAGAALARATTDRDTVATTVAASGDGHALTAFVVGAMLGSFGFHWRSQGPEHHPVRRMVLAGLADDDYSGDLERGLELGGAGWRARMLSTVPSNLKSPQWLAEQAETLAREHGLACEIWDERKLAKQGFGGIVGVGQASATPPRLIRLDYAPTKAGRRTPRVVLVGKGITFDTGGLSIKPGEGMTTMKRDMTGGAVVLAVMAALGRLGCPVRVTGLVPAAENAIGGNALRPGDVLTQYGGRTTEVLNTDAEGRLVLADAMAYAVDHLDPAVIVDVATLTGAMKVALGQRVGGFFANDERLATRLFEAGEASGEPLWRMPLEPDYEDTLASTVADSKNNPGGPGAITAALFLQHFAGDVPWAHLDLASVGDSPSESFEWTTGPSGFGARALLTWLTGPEPLAGIG